MKYVLAQLNIAQFKLPQSHPVNADFVNNIDAVNALAEKAPGFVWRLVGEGNDALDIQAFDDPNTVVNMSVWQDMESLAAFVYRNDAHRQIMRRRNEWFEHIEFYLLLWWVPVEHTPNVNEAKSRLAILADKGPTLEAFTFGNPFQAPSELMEP